METVKQTLNNYGQIGVEALKQDVNKVSATGKTAESIRYEVTMEETIQKLTFYGRKFFKALETGRKPRESSEYSGFDVSMYEYMQARGIGADLPEKKRKQLAKFLAYKINKEGDKTYKQGGRKVYSPTLTKLVDELTIAIIKDVKLLTIKEIIQPLKAA
jgi:hypothetical protein